MYSVRSEECSIEADGQRIFGTLHVPEDGAHTHPLVIMSLGFCDAYWPEDPLALRLAGEGFLCYEYDFCGGGFAPMSDGDVPEASVLTVARDLSNVMDALMSREDVDENRIVLLGRSQSGLVSAYVAACRPKDVLSLVLFFPVFVLQNDARAREDDDGSLLGTSEIMGVKVGRVHNEDAVSFDIYDMIGAFEGKVLILHGDQDRIVPLSYSQRAVSCYRDARLEILPGMGHGIRSEQDYTRSTRIVVDFLKSL